MTAQDMADYTAPLRDPVTWTYRGYHAVRHAARPPAAARPSARR